MSLLSMADLVEALASYLYVLVILWSVGVKTDTRSYVRMDNAS